MYYNSEKTKPVGPVPDVSKLKKKVHKSHEQLKRHDPEVEISSEPTEHLLVGNSSVLCGVSLEELEDIFLPVDSECSFIVYPNKRSYSFISFSSVTLASLALENFHGVVPPNLKTSHLPFIISYVKNLPTEKTRADVLVPKDLVINKDFITEEEEEEILKEIYANPKLKSMKHRAVVHYDHEFDYSTNAAFNKTDPVPPIINRFIDRLLEEGICTVRPDQVTANVYEPGQGIPSHYDTHSAFDDPVISLSMLSDVVMEFKDGANSARIAPVLLPRRSLCLIQGESRYRWKHGIVNRKHDVDPVTNRVSHRKLRVSITFRKIRHRPCECEYKEFCDWDRGGEMGIPSTAKDAIRLEDSYVSDVYENIASHFDLTRHSSWTAVMNFIRSLAPFSVLYDVGCGNGKYLIPKDNLIKFGCDMCLGLCSIAASKGCSVARADALSLPFKEGADAVICIAVLHHISSIERRRLLVEEIIRVLRPGGRACITVWSMDQKESEYAKMRGNKEEQAESVISDAASRLRVHDGKDFSQQDVLVPWTNDGQGETFLRYYHVFREGEMEELIDSIDGCSLESVEKEQGNYIAVIRRDE